MRALTIRKFGAPEVLEVREVEDPTPAKGQVRVAVEAAGLNFAEVSARQGIYPAAPKPPCVVGYEGAGLVDAVGDGVTGFEVGDRVMFISRFGAHAEKVCVPETQLVAIPESLSFVDAAAMPVNYLTAYQMLFRIRRIAPGDHVLIHAAAGGVGTAVLQLCKTVEGVTTYGTASAKKHDYVREHGCDHPIDYRTQDYVKVIGELTGGRGVDLVCDALGGEDWAKGYSILRPSGLLICFGFANAQVQGKRNLFRVVGQFLKIPKFKALDLMSDNRGVVGLDLGSLWEHTELIQDGLERVAALHAEGAIAPHVDRTFTFAEGAEAHRYIEGGKNRGKVVFVPGG